jgi:two-component system sensor histidine kinase MprB
VQTLQGRDGNPYRVATVSVIPHNLAVLIGYPLSNMDDTLEFLRLMLVLVALGGVAVAAGLGWLVGRTSIRPVETLSWAAEHVAETQDLSATIDDTGKDELGRLARSFNAMLGALAASRQQQAQLVSDAGHELRTPLTSLRTNIEVLLRTRDLPSEDRDALLADVGSQLQELTTLVGDLVDLAREDEKPEEEPEPVPLADLVQRAVDRAQRRAQSLHFEVSLQPGQLRAQPALLERAFMNVLDNAAKWSPPGGTVSVKLEAGDAWHLTVTDQGPGVAVEDLPHIFERFYRAQSARSMPGSGLGLSIVKRVVTSHGGTVEVASPPGGGTRVEIELPLDREPID